MAAGRPARLQRGRQVEDVLVEERHLPVLVGVVEVDGGLEGPPATGTPDAGGEVRGEVVPELEEQDEELAVRRGESEPRGVEVDDDGAGLVSFAKAASIASVTGCGVGTSGSKPLRPTRVRPIRAPLRPFGSTNRV